MYPSKRQAIARHRTGSSVGGDRRKIIRESDGMEGEYIPAAATPGETQHTLARFSLSSNSGELKLMGEIEDILEISEKISMTCVELGLAMVSLLTLPCKIAG